MKNRTSLFLLAPLVFVCVLATSAVHAAPSAFNNIYMQYGNTESRSNTEAYTLGVTTPWEWSRSFMGMKVTGYWDLYSTRMGAKNPVEGDYKTWLVGVTPTLRVRMDEGRSPWFVESGIGVSYSDVLYRNQAKEFSSRFNFADHMGIGVSFGQQRSHEVVVRLQHYSNGGIKKPNPGENYIQLRYAYAF